MVRRGLASCAAGSTGWPECVGETGCEILTRFQLLLQTLGVYSVGEGVNQQATQFYTYQLRRLCLRFGFDFGQAVECLVEILKEELPDPCLSAVAWRVFRDHPYRHAQVDLEVALQASSTLPDAYLRPLRRQLRTFAELCTSLGLLKRTCSLHGLQTSYHTSHPELSRLLAGGSWREQALKTLRGVLVDMATRMPMGSHLLDPWLLAVSPDRIGSEPGGTRCRGHKRPLERPLENTVETRPKLVALASNVFAPLVTKPCNPCNPCSATLNAMCPLTM